MEYSAKVNVSGKTYSITYSPITGAVHCVNCGTLRSITSAKTLATIFAAWANQVHAEALEMNEALKIDASFEAKEENYQDVYNALPPFSKAGAWVEAHDEALVMNAKFDQQSSTQPLCSIYQRADGMQLAVDQDGTARFMRPFKQAKWLRAGFEANLEFYWLVERGVKIQPTSNIIASFEEGILTSEEVE